MHATSASQPLRLAMAFIAAVSLAAFDLRVSLANWGMTMIARIAMIATVIITSTNVKPRCDDRRSITTILPRMRDA